MAHCCTCAANKTKDSRNRINLKRDSASHVLSVLLEIFAGITDQDVLLGYLCLICFRDGEKLVSLNYSQKHSFCAKIFDYKRELRITLAMII